MRLDLLPRLACPACGGGLEFQALEALPADDGDVASGTLACSSCRGRYPIADSVPRLLPPGPADAGRGRTRAGFTWEWERYPGSLPEDKAVFLTETQLAEGDFRGRLALDVGCGMGRYARVAMGLGAEVVAFDLSDSLLRLLPAAKAERRLHLVQGDLLFPPFKRGVFDIVYSQGVLHHTPDARAAFGKIAGLAKTGGTVSVWVYGRAGSWSSFSTNPLRPGRAWLRWILPLAWAVVGVRGLLSDAVRAATTRLPVPFLYALCWPLALLGAVPVLKYATFSAQPGFKVRWIENFDWLAPPYQSKHTKEELAGWFEESGVRLVSRLPHGLVPKVGALGRKERR